MKQETDENAVAASSKSKNRAPPDEWDVQARQLIKGVMATRGFRFKTLAARLEALGHPITEGALTLRVNRGTFNLGYALLMLRAMGETELNIKHIQLGENWEGISKQMGYRGGDVLGADEKS